MAFQDIIGNSNVGSLLSSIVSSNNILHSYMFVGPDGIGKSLFAKEFAKLILNVSYDLSNHPDFMIVSPEDGKTIKIEQIRYLQEKIVEKPYLIDNSDTMTKEAQNCLLKTLEEPPEYAIIVLVLSNENKLLNTIKSRCTKIIFHPLSDEDMEKYFLANHKQVPSKNILKMCGGSIGKMVLLQNELDLYEQIDNIINNILQSDIVDVWNNSKILYESKDSIYNFLDYINVILFDKLLDTKDNKYTNCIKIVEQTKRKLYSNANYDMCIDWLLLKIWEEFHEEYCWS